MNIKRTIDDVDVEIYPEKNTVVLTQFAHDRSIEFLVTEYFDSLRDPFDSSGLVRQDIENGIELSIGEQRITLTNDQEKRLARLLMSYQRQLLT